MEILGKDILGALTPISINDNETFRELDERVKKEHGMRMNFSNLEFGEGLDPDQNVLAYFSRWHALNENNQHSHSLDKLTMVQVIPQENGFIQEESEEEEGEDEQECEVEDTFHAVMHDIKYEENPIDVKPFTLPGVYEVPLPEPISDEIPIETLEPTNDSLPTSLCRLCAIPGKSMIDLFGPNEPFDNIVEKIEDCLPIVVKRTDTLPKQVCRSCLYKLELCHQFHKTVAEAERQLTMFDGKIPGEIGTMGESDQISRLPKYDQSSIITSDDDEDDTDSMPLSERLRIANVIAKNPSSLKKLIHYTRDFFSTEFADADNVDDDDENRRWSWSDGYESSETFPEITTVRLDSQERFFAKYMLPVSGETVKTSSDSRQCSPKIATRSDTSKKPKRRGRRVAFDYALFGDKTLLQKAFSSELVHCLICGHGFPTAKQCHKHAQIHYSNNYYPCSLCDKIFVKEIECDEHNLEHIEADGRKFGIERLSKYGCNECGKKFSTKARLQFHKIFHDPIAKACHCIKCDKTFSSEVSLYQHVFSVHTMQKEYFCFVCGQEFRVKAQLDGHKSKHITIATMNKPRKPVSCADCGQSFARRANLIVHTRVHSGERPFKCDICAVGYRSKAARNVHRKTHFPCSRRRPYKCPYCDKYFTRSCTRNNHMRIHTRQIPSPCNVCGKQFKLETTMQRHRKCHERIYPLAITQESS